MSFPAPPSTKLPPALLLWLEALVPSLPSLQELDANDRPKRVVRSLADLNDGVVLGDVVARVDPAYFRPSTSNQRALETNWVLRFNNLKRLYKLLIRYFEDVLHASTTALPAPNLQLIAKGEDGAEDEICRLAGLVLALVVQSDHREQHIEIIQGLEEWAQREIMWSIEQVTSKVRPNTNKDEQALNELGADADSEFYALQHERSRLLNDKETLQVVYEELVRTYGTLKDDHEEALSRLSAAEAKASEALAAVDLLKSDRADVALKAEIDRLRASLEKSENQLADAEQVVDNQTKGIEELTRKVDELTPRAEEATRLKDQIDEFRHAAEKAKKTENALEKYKKKLEESADLRRTIKTLEDQNLDLLDKNAELEEEFKKVSAFKPLMESYKTQLDTLESKNSTLSREIDTLRHERQRTESKLQSVLAEREKETEALTLYEERVRELELNGEGKKRSVPRRESDASGLNEEADEVAVGGVGGELDDAISGTTMTDLKLQVRKLQRDLKAAQANKADGSRIVVLENLLEDANRMKSRYEQDALKEHREKLVLSSRLEEIMSGKSGLGNGPEAALALRIRLNETVEELARLQRLHSELDVKCDGLEKELTIATSDLILVDKDQVDVLRTLRASVSVEKEALAVELEQTRKSLKIAEETKTMQLAQINKLLLQQVDLQNDSIGQRERMIEKERDVGSLKASLGGKALSAEDRARIAKVEEDLVKSQAELRDSQDKLRTARKLLKDQDKMFKEVYANQAQHGNLEEAEQGYKSEIAHLKEELQRQKVRLVSLPPSNFSLSFFEANPNPHSQTNNAEVEACYRREQQLMLSAWHEQGMKIMREGVGGPVRAAPASWLAASRLRANGRGLR